MNSRLLIFSILGILMMQFCFSENIEEGKIYIVSNLTFQDAISVKGIMSENDIMLITDQNFLPKETENFLNNVSNKEIIIVGGNFVIKENVRKKIKEIAKLKNLTVKEIYGKEAEDTAFELIKFKNFSNINTIIIVNKNSVDDCFSASSITSFLNFPIAYTEKEEIPNSTINIIEKFNVKEIIIVGGEGIISKKVENVIKKYNVKISRKWGITAKDTNEEVKKFL
ncbi:MAG: cell wall-binding repeat-containing protein, partial [Candidatus Altarchaeaceae archaeon]